MIGSSLSTYQHRSPLICFVETVLQHKLMQKLKLKTKRVSFRSCIDQVKDEYKIVCQK